MPSWDESLADACKRADVVLGADTQPLQSAVAQLREFTIGCEGHRNEIDHGLQRVVIAILQDEPELAEDLLDEVVEILQPYCEEGKASGTRVKGAASEVAKFLDFPEDAEPSAAEDDPEEENPAEGLFQMHQRNSVTGDTSMIAQGGPFASEGEVKQWSEDVIGRHDLASGCEWVLHDWTAPEFVMAVPPSEDDNPEDTGDQPDQNPPSADGDGGDDSNPSEASGEDTPSSTTGADGAESESSDPTGEASDSGGPGNTESQSPSSEGGQSTDSTDDPPSPLDEVLGTG